jgi:superfamily II DNA or RNA helicase
MAGFSEFLSSFDLDAGKRGKQFEHFVKWFLKNDPEWATQVDQVWLWDEYPEKWGRDCGVDLVFKHKNGENWAVQAKCYAPTTTISKSDIDTFLSESNRDGIDKRLLIATTDLIGANAKQVCDAQDKRVTRYLLSHFDESDIEFPVSLDDLPKAKQKDKPTPREHQLEAIEAVSSGFQNADRGQMIMACGTGKTFTTLWVKEKLSADSTLVLLPSLGLLSQTLHEWTMASNESFEVLCVCSDESVGKRGSDESVHSIADLAFPVTSNPEEIKDFLRRLGKKVIFSTYQSSPLIAEAQEDRSIPSFDLAIADEAHRCAGKVSGDFSTILDGERIRAKKRLFTTATPRTYSSNVKKTAEDRGVEVVGMDDEEVFGKTLFALNFGEAIKRGLLTDYQVVIIGVDNPTISAWIENRELLKAESGIEMDAESLASQVGLIKAIKDYDLHRMISFHSRVKRAEEFSQDIHKVISWIDERHKPSGELKSDFVTGEMPTEKRRKKLSQLKNLQGNQRGLLANARCLSEGVDVPSLDGVAFIDPRSSQIDIIQAVGRAIRLSSNKKVGTIILPVFIGKSNDHEKAFEEGNFKPIWDVLNALKAHDDVLADELNLIRTKLGRKGGGKVNSDDFSKITIDLPVGIDQSFGDGLRTLIVENSSDTWNYRYGELLTVVSNGENPNLPQDYPPNQRLSYWVGTQQQAYKNKLLSNTQIKLLEDLGFIWNLIENKWQENYRQLLKVKESGLDVNLPKGKNASPLAHWVASQRMSRKKGMLSEEKISLLQDIGIIWDVKELVWYGYFNQLKAIYISGGNVNISEGDASTRSLALWLRAQRYRKKSNKLSLLEEKLLSEIGVVWDLYEANWNENYSYLKSLKDSGFDINNLPNEDAYILIKRWLVTQRQNYKKDLLSEGRLSSLMELGFVVDPLIERWNSNYLALKQIYDSGENPNITREKGSKNDLASWLKEQRKRKNNGKMSSERIDLLSSIGIIWDTFENAWQENFNELKAIKDAGGNVNGPFKSDGYSKISVWLTLQKQNHKNGTLTNERFTELSKLGVKWLK